MTRHLFALSVLFLTCTAGAKNTTVSHSIEAISPDRIVMSGEMASMAFSSSAKNDKIDKAAAREREKFDNLYDQGKYKESLTPLGYAIDIYEKAGKAFCPAHLQLIAIRYEVLFNHLNDQSTAYRLMAADINRLDKANIDKNTIPVFNYLCAVFNHYELDIENLTTWFNLFVTVSNTGLNIARQNNYAPQFYFPFEAYVLNKAVKMCEAFVELKQQAIARGIDASVINAPDGLFSNVENLKNMLSAIDQVCRMYRERVPDYKHQEAYFTLLATAENYYTNVNPDPKKAGELYVEHIQLTKDSVSKAYAQALVGFGDYCKKYGALDEAQAAYMLAYDALSKIKLATVRNTLFICDRLIPLFRQKNDYNHMLGFSRAHFQKLKLLIDANYVLLTQQEQDNFITNTHNPSRWLCECLDISPDRRSIAGEVYDAVLFSTGMQLRSQKSLNKAISESGDSQLAEMKVRLDGLRSRLKQKSFNVDSTFVEYLSEEGKMKDEINLLEHQILDKVSTQLKSADANANLSWLKVRDKLKADEAAIEFISAGKHFMALVVKPGCVSPVPIELVATDSLQTVLRQLGTKSSAATARKLYGNNSGVDLYAMLWQPLEKELQGVDKVYYATQGILYTIAFDAIRTSDGKYLADKYDLCPLTTTAQLLEETGDRRPQSILAMGNIFYTDKQRQQVAQGDVTGARGGDDDTSFDDFSERAAKRYHFKYLPFTKQEIEAMTANLKNCRVTLKEGNDATEQALRTMLQKKPDVVHLATHGFFIANTDDARKVPFFSRYQHALNNSGSSMQRAGMALAGAEDTWRGLGTPEEDNDGIFTANEVAQMDLHGTQLITLSACETALGNYSFEGVFGLPRGFKQAGAKSLLVSLWSVNDKSTALLMTAFYRYWMQGATKHEAFRRAVQDVRKDYPDPYYWAPFLLLDAPK